MMRFNSIWVIGLLVICFSACHKEQKSADKLIGTWQINELQWANGQAVQINDDIHKIEFFSCDQAYTATCGGVYFLDYSDSTQVDLKDTIQFDIKNDELAVTNVKKTLSSNNFVVRFMRQRFTLDQLDKSELTLTRIPTFKDSTLGYLKATKL
jgi:hypothetical protein